MFLLKTAFWLSLLILLIPAGKEIATAGQGEISTREVLAAARAVWTDAAGFCDRNPETCETGSRLGARFADKARNGARMLHTYLAEDSSDRNGSEDGVADLARR